MINICEDRNNDYIRLYGISTPGSKLIMYNDEIAGMIDYDVYDEYVKIHYITVHDEFRRKGIATHIIKQIIEENRGKYLYGDSLPKAIEFWASIGVEFDEYIKEDDDDYLTPFHLDC